MTTPKPKKAYRNLYQQGKRPVPEERILQLLNNFAEQEFEEGTRTELIECIGFLKREVLTLDARRSMLESGWSKDGLKQMGHWMKVNEKIAEIRKYQFDPSRSPRAQSENP